MFSAIPLGDTPVSNRIVCDRSPRRVVTRAEKPCSATRPATVVATLELGSRDRGRPPMAARLAGAMSAIKPS